MVRQVSSLTRKALYSQETDVGFPVLLTINHSSLDKPKRFTNWDITLRSRGEDFIPYPFEITFPQDSIEASPRAQLRIDNVDRQIVETLRVIKTRANVTVEVVTTNNFDEVEASFSGFELKDIQYDAFVVSGSLEPETFLREPYPYRRFTPGAFRGVF